MDPTEAELHAIQQTLDSARASGASTSHVAELQIRLGQCQFRLGRRREALELALLASKSAPAEPQWLDALGSLLTHLEEPTRALPHFERAVALAPQNIDYRYNLAMAQRMTGHLQAAETNLDMVIAHRPLDGEAHHARSGLRRQTAGANHVGVLEKTLTHLRGRRASIPVAFALAKELEDLGEYPRSFTVLRNVCDAYRRNLRYDVADDVAVLDRLRVTHTPAALRPLVGNAAIDEPIFIIGLPRSGTTLVERILGGHSQVHAAGELDAFPRMAVDAVNRSGIPPRSKQEFAERLLTVDVQALGADYLAATRPRTGHTPRFTDKLPMNYLYVGVIHAALPRATIIAVQRHPMDSCYAMYKTLFAAAYPFTYDLGDLGRYYVAWRKLMTHWREILGDSWLEIHYEDIVSDQQTASRRIVEHCGLPWEEDCLAFHAQTAGVTTASAVQVRMPLYADSVGKWRRFSQELAPLTAILEDNGISVE